MVLRSVVITDLTRMRGNRRCLAGYAVTRLDPDFCLRPVFRRGDIQEAWLFATGRPIRPFSQIQLRVGLAESDPPHCEDRVIDVEYTIQAPVLPVMDQWALLTSIDDGSVASLYGDGLVAGPRPFVAKGKGQRSLGTVFADVVQAIEFSLRVDGTWRYRLTFHDRAGAVFDLPVTDLAFCNLLDHLRLQDGKSPAAASALVLSSISTSSAVALRVGLARPFPDDHERRCYLQVNGIYTEPDYLNGRCFADFVVRTGVPRPPIVVPF